MNSEKKKNETKTIDLFHASAVKGYYLKVLFDVFAASLTRVCFVFDKEGIFLRDGDKRIMFDLSLLRENFRKYKCSTKHVKSTNTKHLQKLVRNVKKKDSMTLNIAELDTKHLGIFIRPEVSAKQSSRSEMNHCSIFDELEYEPITPPDEKFYGYPVVIDASDFQKIKRLCAMGSTIKIDIQSSNFLSFSCESGEVYDSTVSFGEKSDDDEEAIEYSAEFQSTVINQLVKLPGLCNQIQFYAPSLEGAPLMIRLSVGTLGTLSIYIMDDQHVQEE